MKFATILTYILATLASSEAASKGGVDLCDSDNSERSAQGFYPHRVLLEGNDRCILISRTKHTFEGCENFCEKKANGTLITSATDKERKRVLQALKILQGNVTAATKAGEKFWVGLYKNFLEKWEWVNSEKTYALSEDGWDSGQPNNGQSRCAMMHTGMYRFNDAKACCDRGPCICETNVEPNSYFSIAKEEIYKCSSKQDTYGHAHNLQLPMFIATCCTIMVMVAHTFGYEKIATFFSQGDKKGRNKIEADQNGIADDTKADRDNDDRKSKRDKLIAEIKTVMSHPLSVFLRASHEFLRAFCDCSWINQLRNSPSTVKLVNSLCSGFGLFRVAVTSSLVISGYYIYRQINLKLVNFLFVNFAVTFFVLSGIPTQESFKQILEIIEEKPKPGGSKRVIRKAFKDMGDVVKAAIKREKERKKDIINGVHWDAEIRKTRRLWLLGGTLWIALFCLAFIRMRNASPFLDPITGEEDADQSGFLIVNATFCTFICLETIVRFTTLLQIVCSDLERSILRLEVYAIEGYKREEWSGEDESVVRENFLNDLDEIDSEHIKYMETCEKVFQRGIYCVGTSILFIFGISIYIPLFLGDRNDDVYINLTQLSFFGLGFLSLCFFGWILFLIADVGEQYNSILRKFASCAPILHICKSAFDDYQFLYNKYNPIEVKNKFTWTLFAYPVDRPLVSTILTSLAVSIAFVVLTEIST